MGYIHVRIYVHDVAKNWQLIRGSITFHWNSNVGICFVSRSLYKHCCKFGMDYDMVMSFTYEKFKKVWWDEFPYMQWTCIYTI